MFSVDKAESRHAAKIITSSVLVKLCPSRLKKLIFMSLRASAIATAHGVSSCCYLVRSGECHGFEKFHSNINISKLGTI
jgi:hypothetical protein